MSKKRQEEQYSRDDLVLKRGMLWAAGAVVLEVLLFLVNRYAFDIDATAEGVAIAEALRAVLRVLRLAGAAACVLGVVLFVMQQMKKSGKGIWAAVAFAAGTVVMVCAHVAVKYQAAGMRMLYLLVPAMAGLAVSYYVYQREFFVAALSTVLAVLGLWFVRVGGMGAEVIATVLFCVAVLVAVLKLKKGNGCLKAFCLMPEKTNYTMVLGSCAAAIAVQLLAVVAGSAVAYYLLYAMAAWLFALLVYYTVKML